LRGKVAHSSGACLSAALLTARAYTRHQCDAQAVSLRCSDGFLALVTIGCLTLQPGLDVGDLALEVLLEFHTFGPAPDTGTTKGDLVAIVRGVNTGLAHPTATAKRVARGLFRKGMGISGIRLKVSVRIPAVAPGYAGT
jgi:hypothetical protein